MSRNIPTLNRMQAKVEVIHPWISVESGMPKDGDEVIIWHVLGDGARSPHTMDFAHWLNGKWVLPWHGVATWVKAWRPKPSEPIFFVPDED